MPFPEPVKLLAKQQANFRCIVCHQPWVEVHHILPQANGGADDIDNAAPLCGSCHTQYGGNPDLRKQMRERRDWWWARCAQEGQTPADAGVAERLDKFHEQIVKGQKRHDEVLGEVKSVLLLALENAKQNVQSSVTIGAALSFSGSLSTGVDPTGFSAGTTSVSGTHSAEGIGRVTGLDVQGPAIIQPGTISRATGKGDIAGTRIGPPRKE